jgi:hypothetical protein
MLLPGLAVTPDLATSSIVVIGNYGCPPLLDVEISYGPVVQNCEPKTLQTRNALAERMSSVRDVVLVSRGPVYFSGSGFGREIAAGEPIPLLRLTRDPGTARSQREIFIEGYARTISFLQAQGKRVIFFIDVPEIGFDPVECVDIRPLRFSTKQLRQPCSIPANEVASRQADYRAVVAELQARFPEMRVFDPTSLLCDAQSCQAMIDGTVIYRDDDHLSAAGSGHIAAALKQFIAQPASTPSAVVGR